MAKLGKYNALEYMAFKARSSKVSGMGTLADDEHTAYIDIKSGLKVKLEEVEKSVIIFISFFLKHFLYRITFNSEKNDKIPSHEEVESHK